MKYRERDNGNRKGDGTSPCALGVSLRRSRITQFIMKQNRYHDRYHELNEDKRLRTLEKIRTIVNEHDESFEETLVGDFLVLAHTLPSEIYDTLRAMGCVVGTDLSGRGTEILFPLQKGVGETTDALFFRLKQLSLAFIVMTLSKFMWSAYKTGNVVM